jgi:hypothetical protein
VICEKKAAGKPEGNYSAEGINKKIVCEKAMNMLEVKNEKDRFALPKAGAWRRDKLKPMLDRRPWEPQPGLQGSKFQ